MHDNRGFAVADMFLLGAFDMVVSQLAAAGTAAVVSAQYVVAATLKMYRDTLNCWL